MPARRKKPAGMTAVQAVVMQELENIVGKKNGPASVGALPDHGSTIPAEETAMNRPNDATRPVDPATIDFQDAFEALEDDLLILERRLYTADFLLNGVTEATTDHLGFRRISTAEVEALCSTMQDTCDALHEVMTAWRTTHDANCAADFKAYAAGRTA